MGFIDSMTAGDRLVVHTGAITRRFAADRVEAAIADHPEITATELLAILLKEAYEAEEEASQLGKTDSN
jgi:hypothetical protein